MTISGSGTTYTITLAQPIDRPDRVTVTIAGPGIVSYTRRLDLLPGDFNDDGVVNSKDLLGVLDEWGRINGVVPTIFGDINGEGAVNGEDYSDVLHAIGTKLPPVGGGAVASSISLSTTVGSAPTSGPAPKGSPTIKAVAAWTSPRTEVRLAVRGRGWSLGTSSRIGGLDPGLGIAQHG